MKKLLLASLITLLAFGTACGQAPEPEPAASDGIQVHGHWTVTVTNPDGTVDAMHEFDNSLGDWAPELLTALIVGEVSLLQSGHRITITSSPTDPFTCMEFGGTASAMKVLTPNVVRQAFAPDAPLIFSATCTIEASQVLVNLSRVSLVFSPDPPLQLDTSVKRDVVFTKEQLNPNIEVVNGQAISFNITITFS